jgi:glycosyltransferase involved in cell wall biosynthesis
MSQSIKTAVVHEWLSIIAGSERVVEQILTLYPDADIFTLVDFFNEHERKIILGKRPQTSFIQNLPFSRRSFRKYLPLMPLAVEQFDVSSYDVVISSHHAVAKGVLTHQNQLHICYCHSPMRYAWDFYHDYLRSAGLQHGLKGWFAKFALHYLRMWDVASVNRVDTFIANSHYIANRIKHLYNRNSEVIYPPVNTQYFTLQSQKDSFYLTAGRFVPYKKISLIVEAFSKMPDKKLVVIGNGDEMASIKSRASRNIEFLDFQPLESLKKYMQSAKAFIYAAEEDFGISIVEAQSCGTPVVAFGKGGASETVIDNKTGVLFYEQNVESLINAVNKLSTLDTLSSPESIRQHAEMFSNVIFQRKIKNFIDKQYEEFKDKKVYKYEFL